MLYSNNRKLSLSGWLQKNNISAYCSPLRLQKFLFFYEAFSKVKEGKADFARLKGYQRGPVFSTVWGDYTKDRKEFDQQSLLINHYEWYHVNDSFAQSANFIVSSLSEKELSELTHQYHIWSAKRDRIMSGEQQVELEEKDFTELDYTLTNILDEMYPLDMIQKSEIIPVGEKYFVFSRDDIGLLTEQHFDTMANLSDYGELHNPVYVELDPEGRLCVD